MCEFLSAVKVKHAKGSISPYYEDGYKWYFLTHDLIHNTPRGEIIQKKFPGSGELIGHSAIREYYGLRSGEGENWERSDFSTPENFPTIIARAIKRGEFRGFGEPAGLLIATADKAWKEAIATADKAWQEAKATAFWDLFAIPENRAKAWR